jgi:hypothetical protein
MQKDKIGKYKIVSQAGAGAFGIVWRTISSEDNKVYAVKEISKNKITKQLLENLIREVHISQKLEHRNLIRCFTTMESKNNYYIVFEFCEGGDLGKYLSDMKKIPLPEVLHIMRQIRDGYKYLLNQNILHRDIKLDNILLNDREKMVVKLSDFGCSKIDPFGTTVCGTPKYMAVEVMDNINQYNYKADLWSIGLCFWELIYGNGSFPFSLKSSDNLKNDIKKFSGENLRFPVSPKLPAAFYDFLKKILQLSPQLRMDAKDFLEHPVFNLEGSEQELDQEMANLSTKKVDADALDPQYNFTLRQTEPDGLTSLTGNGVGQGLAFTNIKKHYNEKILEVKLIKTVVKELKKFLKNTWDKKFLSYYRCLCLIIISKASIRAENCYATLNERKNSYKLPYFHEFTEFPNECLPIKDEIKQSLEELKKMDDEIYSELINDCFSPQYLEDINNYLYKNTNTDGKKTFLAEAYQYVKKNGSTLMDEFDKGSFEVQMKRTFIILKGEVLQKIEEFH